MKKMKEAKQEKAQDTKMSAEQRLSDKQFDDLVPELPRFEGFYKSLSKDKDMLEDEQYQFDEDKGQRERQAEEKQDEEMLERELRGRLIGEKLTPRQFALLYKARVDDKTNLKFIRNKEREQFVNNRDMIRIFEENMESYRRKQVLSGTWTEQESKGKL